MPRMSIRSIRYRRPKNITWDTDLEERIHLRAEDLPKTWDFSAIFGREAPVQVEIGFGRGRFILAAAEKWTECNWLGIEYSKPCVLLASERSARAELHNVRIVQAAAEDLLRDHVPDACVDAFHVYFPDPWPKKRHHKRRIFQPPFIASMLRTLKPGGHLHVATDYTEYYEKIVPMVREGGFELVDLDDDVTYYVDDEEFRTNFEEKALERGESIHRARFRKPEG